MPYLPLTLTVPHNSNVYRPTGKCWLWRNMLQKGRQITTRVAIQLGSYILTVECNRKSTTMKSNTDLWYDLDNIANVFKASELNVRHQLRSVQHTETYNKKWTCGEEVILQNSYQSQYLQVYVSPILTHQIPKAEWCTL